MSAPSKVYKNQLVKIQPEESLANTSELNLTPERVTVHREAKGMEYRASTVVKGLSSEIIDVSVADVFHICGRQYFNNRYWQGCISPTESEAVARYKKADIGTWETLCISENQICGNKSEEDKESQMIHRESDQFIVVMKQSNVCGAKGLTGGLRIRETSNQLDWVEEGNTTKSMTYSTEGKEGFLKSRMRENCTYGSVRGLMVDSQLKRRWL